ncbi:MAG: hypothetical protein Q8L78_04245 [Coxiellaceae bacterium]|nr:hypothetical protein [Coxiellaceae bacterium]
MRTPRDEILKNFLDQGEIPKGKTVYDILGVPEDASLETIKTAGVKTRTVMKNIAVQAPVKNAASAYAALSDAVEALKKVASSQSTQKKESVFEYREPPLSPTEPVTPIANDGEFPSSSPLRKKIEVPLRKFDALLSFIATGDTRPLEAMSYRKRMELNKEHSKEGVVSAREAAFKILFDMLKTKELTDIRRDRVITAIFTVEEASGELRKKLGENPEIIHKEHEEVERFLEEQFPKASRTHGETQQAIIGAASPTVTSPVVLEQPRVRQTVAGSQSSKQEKSVRSPQTPNPVVGIVGASPLKEAVTVGKKSSEISRAELKEVLDTYKDKSTAVFWKSPGPEYAAIKKLLEEDKSKDGWTLREIQTVVEEASKKFNGKSHRAELLTKPNAHLEDKTGVSGVIRAIGEKFSTKENKKTVSPK